MKPSSLLSATVSPAPGKDLYQITLEPKSRSACVGIKYLGSTLTTAAQGGEVTTSLSLQIDSFYHDELIAVAAVMQNGHEIPLILRAFVTHGKTFGDRVAKVDLQAQHTLRGIHMVTVSQNGITLRMPDGWKYSSCQDCGPATHVPNGDMLLQTVMGRVRKAQLQRAAQLADPPPRRARLDVHRRVH